MSRPVIASNRPLSRSSNHGDFGVAELLAEVRRIEVLSRRLVTDEMAGGYNSVFRGSGIEFDEVREYEEGDDPRTVDWSVTARLGRPYVKKYVDERALTILFVLDLSPSMLGGFGAWSAREMAARIVACLALSAVRNNDKVGLVAFGETVDRFVPPGKGSGHVLRIVRDCLALPSRPGRTDMTNALEVASRVMRRRAVVFFLSDFFATGWSDALRRCALRHDVIAAHLRVPELTDLATTRLRVRDPETDEVTVVDGTDEIVRAAYRESVARHAALVADTVARARADLMDVPIPRDADRAAVARPILQFFRMREERGGRR